jgi:hypothetical protein
VCHGVGWYHDWANPAHADASDAMISFECPLCDKPLIVPNRSAGASMKCPDCRGELVVPPVPERRAIRRYLWLIPAAAVLALLIGAAFWSLRPDESAQVRERFQTNLRARSPKWKGVEWQRCDARNGDYRLTVRYTSDRGAYAFEVGYYPEAGGASVHVNPSGNRWLARANFGTRDDESFEYRGINEGEREELARLSRDVCRALADAVNPPPPGK